MPERWRSQAARDLVRAIRAAGGSVERAGVGRLRVSGPRGSVTIAEPGGDTRRDLRRDSAAQKILDGTGVDISSAG